MICPVSSMRNGQWGNLVQVDGGAELIDKLASLGIRPGTRIGRKYGLMGRGPVVLTVGTGEVAIGYGMAARMMVQVEGAGKGGHKNTPHPHGSRSLGRRLGLFRHSRRRRGHAR